MGKTDTQKRVFVNSFLLLAYFAIAFLWLYQYPFQATLTWWIRIPGFVFFVVLTFLFLRLGKRFLEKYFYFIIILIVLLGIIPNIIHFNMYQPETCGITRAEAAECFSSRILNSEYPYRPAENRAIPTSGLPIQYLLQLPFYLLGEIGVYMMLMNILLAFFITRFYGRNIHSIFFVILLFIAPPVVFDTGLRSDLVANSALVVFLFLAVDKFRPFNRIDMALLFGVIIGLLGLTRTFVAIPVAIMLISEFSRKSAVPIILTSLVSIGVFVSVMSIFYFWNPETFIEYNPFHYQNRYLPTYLKIPVIILTIITAFAFRNRNDKYILSFVFVGLSVIASLVFTYINKGISFVDIPTTRVEFVFDIHYLCLIIPFLLFSFALGKRSLIYNKGIEDTVPFR